MTLGQAAFLSCCWEAYAPKAGNVHPGAAFPILRYEHFIESAHAIRPVFEALETRPTRVGQTVLDAIRATRRVVATNTNLGIVLLLAPLASVPRAQTLAKGISDVLRALDLEDSRLVVQAIREAEPGGMGEQPQQDIRQEPTLPLVELMRLAEGRDQIAFEYVNNFATILYGGVPMLQGLIHEHRKLEDAMVLLHLWWMANYPDSLIGRKSGIAVAEEAARQAREVFERGGPTTRQGQQAFQQLDAWLRADGTRRNPGTSADLVAACLFAALRDNDMELPEPPPPSHDHA